MAPETPILQFGTSRFLQAHVDLFISDALARGEAAGPITVVQSTDAAERASRLAAFSQPQGFPVRIRGKLNGKIIEREERVTSIRRGLSAAQDWSAIERIAVEEMRFVVSNTGDAGYHVPERLELCLSPGTAPPPFFPARLLALLAACHAAGRSAITILPCELMVANGERLKGLVLDLARRSGANRPLLDWLEGDCMWRNSLVDRIVSAPIEPAGAVAEPYALWAIQDPQGASVPCRHPAIALVGDLEPIERLKLHILNLGHSVLVDLWRRSGPSAPATVREILDTPAIRGQLEEIYHREVIPSFAAHGMEAEARAYVETTLERFANPFLDHRLADIAQNHATKVARRIGDFLEWSRGAGRTQLALLEAVVARSR